MLLLKYSAYIDRSKLILIRVQSITGNHNMTNRLMIMYLDDKLKPIEF